MMAPEPAVIIAIIIALFVGILIGLVCASISIGIYRRSVRERRYQHRDWH